MSDLTGPDTDPLPPPVSKGEEKSKKRGRPPKDDREALKRRAMERKHTSFEPLPDGRGSEPSSKDDVRAVAENENANQLKLKQQHLDTIELFENWFPDRIHKKCGLTLDDSLEKMEEQIKHYKSIVTLQTCDEKVIMFLTSFANIVEQTATTFDPEHRRIDLTNYGKVTFETMNSEQGRMTVRMAIVNSPWMRLNMHPLLDLGFLMAQTAAQVSQANAQKKKIQELEGDMKERKKRTIKPAEVPAFNNSIRGKVLSDEAVASSEAPRLEEIETEKKTPESDPV